MKFYKSISFSIMSLMFFCNTLNVFASPSTMVVSANDSTQLNISEATVISSIGTGEVVSKLSDSPSVFQLSVSEGNKYTTGQYALIVSENSSNENVSVYSQASNTSNELGQIPVGSTILINGTEGNFARILYNDNVGYIESKYTKTTGLVEKEEEKPAQTEHTTQSNNTQTKYAKITAETGLNLRQSPSVSSQVLKQLPFNSYVTILETTEGWYKVKLSDGQIGYISSEFTALTDKIETQQTETPINTNGQNIVNFAKQYLGKPYVYGGTNLNTGTDCSGFTYSVFKNFGISLNRVSKDQYLNGTPVSRDNILPGDLVFFNTGGDSTISHVGIYIGNDQYIHCTDSKNQGVIISSLNNSYALKTYYGARRVIN